jgi:predicted Rossmann-fold nucleotide-binding protein
MKICVFCSSSNAIADIYIQEAIRLAERIGQAQMAVINGGSNVGLMDVVTRAAKNKGAKTIGIIPRKMNANNLTSQHATKLFIGKHDGPQSANARHGGCFLLHCRRFRNVGENLEVIF